MEHRSAYCVIVHAQQGTRVWPPLGSLDLLEEAVEAVLLRRSLYCQAGLGETVANGPKYRARQSISVDRYLNWDIREAPSLLEIKEPMTDGLVHVDQVLAILDCLTYANTAPDVLIEIGYLRKRSTLTLDLLSSGEGCTIYHPSVTELDAIGDIELVEGGLRYLDTELLVDESHSLL